MTIAGFSWLVVTFLVNQYGVNVSAGNGVAIKIKDICQLFISAMASGATTMIAQNLGSIQVRACKGCDVHCHEDHMRHGCGDDCSGGAVCAADGRRVYK